MFIEVLTTGILGYFGVMGKQAAPAYWKHHTLMQQQAWDAAVKRCNEQHECDDQTEITRKIYRIKTQRIQPVIQATPLPINNEVKP